MSETEPVTNLGTPKCPHCEHVQPIVTTPVAKLKIYACSECKECFAITHATLQYTTQATVVDVETP